MLAPLLAIRKITKIILQTMHLNILQWKKIYTKSHQSSSYPLNDLAQEPSNYEMDKHSRIESECVKKKKARQGLAVKWYLWKPRLDIGVSGAWIRQFYKKGVFICFRKKYNIFRGPWTKGRLLVNTLRLILVTVEEINTWKTKYDVKL